MTKLSLLFVVIGSILTLSAHQALSSQIITYDMISKTGDNNNLTNISNEYLIKKYSSKEINFEDELKNYAITKHLNGKYWVLKYLPVHLETFTDAIYKGGIEVYISKELLEVDRVFLHVN